MERHVAWIAAVGKVRDWEFQGAQAYIRRYKPNLGWGKRMATVFFQIDPWQVEVPCRWRIDKTARVELHWKSKPNGTNFRRFPVPRLCESERDEIIHYENNVDTREFFRIDIGDREGWVNAELEEKGREIQEKGRELQRLGLEANENDDSALVNSILEMMASLTHSQSRKNCNSKRLKNGKA